jgi:prepilin-type N-terminal cleavage/methylation domain-containing protein
MRRAFTLIELLVVIAIIAILAAILFPVFAQAKDSANRTVAISNVKQQGLAMIMYATDADDNLPHAFSRRANGTWRWGTVHPTPAGVVNNGGWDAPEIVEQTRMSWANSIFPYTKSWGIFNFPGTSPFSWDSGFTPGMTPSDVALTMNGLMHKLSMSEVRSPSVAIMLWTGTGRNAGRGRSFANPSLNCPSAEDCRFNPSGPSQPGGSSNGAGFLYPGDATAWIFAKRAPMVRTDGSAKAMPIGLKVQPDLHQWPNVNSDPWASVSASGQPRSFWTCGPNGEGDWRPGANYPCYFRPDRER